MKYFALILLITFTCCNQKPKERTEEEKYEARQKENKDKQEAVEALVQFKINGEPFKASGLGYTSELKMDRNLNKPIFRFYFVDNTYQALDMIFFEEPLESEIPYTFPFKSNEEGDQNATDWAVLSFTSGEIPGWHKVPKKDSYIKITEWDKSGRTVSGEFQAYIENSEEKNKTISITEGKFTKLPYQDRH